jgi:CSLREA domain-containing protein
MLAPLLLSACLATLPVTAQAITFTVNSTADDVDVAPGDGVCATAGGVCTLRAAIQEANALAGPDIIVLKAKKYYLAIPGTEENAAATGDLDITDSLTIKGVSSAQTIINGGAVDRVFQIIGPVTVKFVNLSIQNGFSVWEGAGIYNSGGIVSLVSCSVVNNVSAGSNPVMGGGIYSVGVGSSLKIQSSSVVNNAVNSSTSIAYGGGVAVNNGGTLNISASKIAYNSATSSSTSAPAAAGGIVSINGAGVTITNSKVLANRALSLVANSFGGGIALAGDSTAAVISGTTISMNSNTSSGGVSYGGGLYFEGEKATVRACTVKGNRANASASGGLGGGIWAQFSSDITIKNASTIVSNLASFDGGGIASDGLSVTVSIDSTVANNMPNDQNGAGMGAEKPPQLLSP